jgi:hypothetical protein
MAFGGGAMTDNSSFQDKGRPWVPPTITKLAIGTETKSSVAVDQTIKTGTAGSGGKMSIEPQPPSMPASKFGFSFEWSLPLSVRSD